MFLQQENMWDPASNRPGAMDIDDVSKIYCLVNQLTDYLQEFLENTDLEVTGGLLDDDPEENQSEYLN